MLYTHDFYAPYLRYFRGRQKVLDLQCQSGIFLTTLRDEGKEVCGADSDPVFVETWKQRGLLCRVEKPLSFLHTFDAASWEGVFVPCVGGESSDEEVSSLIQEILRILRETGIVVIVGECAGGVAQERVKVILEHYHLRVIDEGVHALGERWFVVGRKEKEYFDSVAVGPSWRHLTVMHEKYVHYFDSCHTVLDIGCGKGAFLAVAQKAGKNVYGIDMVPQLVTYCRERGFSCEIARADSFLQGCADGSWDGVYLSHVIEHLQPDQLKTLLREIARVLTDDGIVVMVTPNLANLEVCVKTFWSDLSHVRPYPLITLKHLLMYAGFRVVDMGQLCADPLKKKKGCMDIFWNYVRKKILGDFFDQRTPGDNYIVAKRIKRASE